MLRLVRVAVPVMLSGVLVLSSTPDATAAQGDEQKALAKSQYLLRQVSGEKSELEKKNKELQDQLTAVKTQLERTQKSLEAQQQLLAATQERNQQQIEALQNQKQETAAQAQQLKRTSELVSHQKSNIETRLDQQKQNFGLCVQNNHKLYEINREILGQYENKGFWTALRQKEPLTGSKKVEIEKLVQDYQYRMDDALVETLPE